MKLNYPAQVHRTSALNFLGIVPVTSRTRRGDFSFLTLLAVQQQRPGMCFGRGRWVVAVALALMPGAERGAREAHESQ
jgi:hypothetical protein